MLPNINLESGQPVAVDLSYTPAAIEVINPCEGNLALAVQAPSILGNGSFDFPLVTLDTAAHAAMLSGAPSANYRKWYNLEDAELTPPESVQAWSISDGKARALYHENEAYTVQLSQCLGRLKSAGDFTFTAGGALVRGWVNVYGFNVGDITTPILHAQVPIVDGQNIVPVNFARAEEFVIWITLSTEHVEGTDFWVDDAAMLPMNVIGNGTFSEPEVMITREESEAIMSGSNPSGFGQWYTVETTYPQAWSISDGKASGEYSGAEPLTMNLRQVAGQFTEAGVLTFDAGGAQVNATADIVCLEPGNLQAPVFQTSHPVTAGVNSVAMDFAREGGFILVLVLRLSTVNGASVWIDNARLDSENADRLTISALQTPARGTRISSMLATLYDGPLPDGTLLIPIDPKLYGLGRVGTRVSMLQFSAVGTRGLSAARAAVVRWTNPR